MNLLEQNESVTVGVKNNNRLRHKDVEQWCLYTGLIPIIRPWVVDLLLCKVADN